MRRSDREVTEFSEIIRIMEACDVCRLALHGGDYPYILPLNFGMEAEGGHITLYFHGADSGRKYELIEADSRAAFEMDCAHRLVTDPEKGYCTMEYESVIGCGRVAFVEGEEKHRALSLIMAHYHPGEAFPFNPAAIPRTRVMKLEAERVTGKIRVKKNGCL